MTHFFNVIDSRMIGSHFLAEFTARSIEEVKPVVFLENMLFILATVVHAFGKNTSNYIYHCAYTLIDKSFFQGQYGRG